MKITHQTRDLGDGYKVKMVSNPDGGFPICTYYYKRNRVRHKVLDSKLAKQMAGYFMIEHDLQRVRAWLGEIGEPSESRYFPDQMDLARVPPVVSGLYVAALTIYGKCFTKAEGRRVKLEKKIFDSHQSKPRQYVSTHEYVMHLRNNLAAHSGSALLDSTEVVLALPPKSKPKVWPRVFKIGMQVQTHIWSRMEMEDDDPSFAELVEYAESWVSRKVDSLKKKVWVEETEKLVRNEYSADSEMLARVKAIEAEWKTPDL